MAGTVNGKLWVGMVAAVVTAVLVLTTTTLFGMPAEVLRNTADISRHEADMRQLRQDISDMKGDLRFVVKWVEDEREQGRP